MDGEWVNDNDDAWTAMEKAGVQKFRMQIKWDTINNAGGGGSEGWKNPWAWENTYDRYFEKAALHGIEILPYLYTRKGGNPQYYWTGEPAFVEWKQFVWTTVQRYGQGGSFWAKNNGKIPQLPVKAWEVWNEPNLPMNCPAEACNGKEYGDFLVATSKTIREAQSALFGYSTQVLFGGLYQESFDPAMNCANGAWCIFDYLKNAAKAAGISSAYDGLSIHPYSLGTKKAGETFRQYPEKATGVWSNVSSAVNAQNQAGLGSKPLWITEVGWPVDYDGDIAQTVNEGELAGLLNETYNWAETHYDIRFVSWYFYKDVANEPSWAYHAGLRDVDGDYRQAWFAYEGQTGATKWPASFRYMLGTSGGSDFTLFGTGLTGMGQPIQADLGDTNNDGKEDIVAVEAEGNGAYRYMRGANTGPNFSWNFTSLTGMGYPWQLAVGDIDGDSKDDIIAVESENKGTNGYGTYRYMRGNSTGTNFTWNFTNLTGMGYPSQMALGDVNGDGKDDIVAVERSGGNYNYMLGTSTGSNFTWNYTSLTGMGYPLKVALGDVNGDGKDDIVAVERSGGNYSYMLGTSTGSNFTWNYTNLTGMGLPVKMELGDTNGDGKDDIVAVEEEGGNKYRYMRGSWTGSSFAWSTTLTGMGQAQEMALGDATGDGKADILSGESYAPGSGGPWYWQSENMGGNITEDPDISSWGANRLDIWGRATDGSYAHKWWDGSSWKGWENLGGAGVISSGVGAVGFGGNRIDALGRNSSNQVVDLWWNGSKWQVENFGGNIVGDPDMTISQNHYDIWARSPSNTLVHRWWTGSSWSPWEDLGYNLASSPSAVSWGTNRIDIVFRAQDGSVQQVWWDGSKMQTYNHGGGVVGAPEISSWGPGRLDIFARGTDNALWHKWYENGWHEWHSLGGSLTSSPGAASWDPNRIDVVARQANNSVQHWYMMR